MGVFRSEALEYHSDTEYGDVVIPASLSMTACAVATLFIFICVVLFVYYGSYTRKAHLTGIVMPSSGLVKITPQYAGYITQLTVSEGQHVIAGEPLYHINGEHFNEQGAGTLAAMNLSLRTQYAMLSSQETLELRDNQQQQAAIKQRIASLQLQVKSAEQRLQMAERQVGLTTSVMGSYKKLAGTHYVSDIEYQQKQIEVSTAQQNVEDQRQGLLQLRTAIEAAKDDLNHLIILGGSRKAELDRQLQEIRQQQEELAGQENITLTAPVSGTVAAVLVRQGQSVRALEPVMTVVPDNASLQIELYAASQNAGFIRPGQRVALRFAAFPYQKFGVQYGTIREISRTTLTPSDLLSVSPVTWKENEGRYRVIVRPENPFILAYGKKEPLRPGMTLEGDVNLDTRPLWEWLTEPLWSLKGKL
ncbi:MULTISPECIES: HlyD family secretion protein [Klebsiella]|nr:HlyD family efflux transporter periplasmic adaptor subunit [Klebsiella variicola]HBQ6667552.1 HlyD family efflux transporter periplasmic adaptor subunit [Klebsiella pneumoniae]AJA98366.1 secretion protein HlyD [Klebsiella variicola]MCD6605006.1 HlyD family efflux transporter periplasmic adaptor subunit [Klebsiella variicola subsp. variicola]WDU71607.1 HlyD family efflux transporter periplasmic adaptor subunit [Klebsiella variicola]HBR1095152.1 HlyD family efflux transporter periplasmic adap